MKKKEKKINKKEEQNLWSGDSWFWIIALIALFGFNGGCTTPKETNIENNKEIKNNG